MKNKKGREAGQSLIEFALVLPILLLLLIGMLNFGEVLTAASMVQQVARDSARFASVGHKDTTIETYANLEINNNPYLRLIAAKGTGAGPFVVVSKASVPVTGVKGTDITVSIHYPIQLWGPIVPSIIGNPYTVQASVTMMAE